MEKLICANCGCVIDDEDVLYVNEDCYCQECFDNLFAYCDECGVVHPIDDMTWVGDKLVCEDCLCDKYTTCDDCGEYVRREDIYETFDGNYICEDCLCNGYAVCDDCGEIYPIDDLYDRDGFLYCSDCLGCHVIMDYHDFDDWHNYKVNSADNGLLKGFELEIDTNDCYADRIGCADDIRDVVGQFCVFERDGSLSNDGIEVISNPFTTSWLYENLDMIKDMLKVINNNGYSNCGDTGLHIHANREQLTQGTTLSEDEVIDNILLIMETFQDELIDFSRRSYSSLNEWSSFLTSDNEDVNLNMIKCRKSDCRRYRALNLCNDDTVEFRLFNSTTDLKELVASIELVDRLIELAKSNNLDGLTWSTICDYGMFLKEYADLDYDTVLNIKKVNLISEMKLYKEYKLNVDNDMYIGKLLHIRESFDGEFSYLFGIHDFNGHNGDDDINVPEEYQGHCWWLFSHEVIDEVS